MKILSGIKEMIYNFSHPIKDSTAIDMDISDEGFIALANANGISQKDIEQLLDTRNGLAKESIPKVKKLKKKEDDIPQEIKVNETRENGDNDRER